MNQQWQKTQDSSPFCGHFHFFIERIKWNLLQYVKLKIHMIFSIYHIFCINFWWINKNFLKVYNFLPNFMFQLKHYLNSNCIKIWKLFYVLFFYFINYNFPLIVMYITPYLHVVKDFWNLKFLFNSFLTFKIFKFHNLWMFFECGQSINIISFFLIKIAL
jgi:hypothetical protein